MAEKGFSFFMGRDTEFEQQRERGKALTLSFQRSRGEHILRLKPAGLRRGGPGAKSTHCSYRESTHTGQLTTAVTPASGDLMPLAFEGVGTNIHVQMFTGRIHN